jgi:chemotaxis protein MotC
MAAAGIGQAARAEEPLQPYQLVRSLQLVQDRIAAGDHAALPMQAKLLEIIDARLRGAGGDDFKDARNFRALLVYGMSGGNPTTVEAAASRVELGAPEDRMTDGILHYLRGRPAAAIDRLRPVDPMTLPADIGAYVALVKGSLLATQEPAEALTLLDQARLLSPGTLVEEAALRRSIAIAAAQGDAARFALASTQYVERYLYSPYASQFADSFVSGVVAMHMAISQDKLADITSMMDPEREKVIYLRIARRAAIDGLNELSTFASARAERNRDGIRNVDDPRAMLYASLSTVTSATVEDLRARLEKIDRSQLSEGDRALLDAADAIARELVAPPATPVRMPAAAETLPTAEAVQPVDTADLPPVEGAMPEPPAAEPPAAPAANATAAPLPPPPSAVAQPAPEADPIDTAIADARRKLDMIDQLLGASPE